MWLSIRFSCFLKAVFCDVSGFAAIGDDAYFTFVVELIDERLAALVEHRSCRSRISVDRIAPRDKRCRDYRENEKGRDLYPAWLLDNVDGRRVDEVSSGYNGKGDPDLSRFRQAEIATATAAEVINIKTPVA